MAKERIQIPSDIAAAVLFASDYTCCVCHERGRSVQIHHIDEDPSNNTNENLSVLCLLCHDKTQIKGGFGRKLNAELVVQYRDDWIRRVILRRDKADDLSAQLIAGVAESLPAYEEVSLMEPADEALTAYANNLPSLLAKAYTIVQPQLDAGVTLGMLEASWELIEVVRQILLHLSTWYPDNHFDETPASEYFARFISTRFLWHRALAEPEGYGTGGTIVGPATAEYVLNDLKKTVDEIVTALLWGHEGFNLKEWRRQWSLAGQYKVIKAVVYDVM